MSVTIRLASLLTLSASLLVFPGCESSCNQPLSANPSGTAGDNAAPGVETAETKLVSFKVEGMTCPSGCYPSVKSEIAKQKGVIGIELAPQKEADSIDNPVVFDKYKGDLDLDSTLKAISLAGFEAQEVAN
jgi:copper chaperone CopZ